jgi:PAS domain S-box-containing protein
MALAESQQPESPVSGQPDALYRLIAETIPHMVWTARADGWLDFFNRRVYEYTGMQTRQLEGWGWKEVVHADEWERCLASWTRSLQTGERYEIELRLRRADGVYRWHHGSAVPLLEESGGHIVHWFGTCTDIESEVQSAQILESMVEERSRTLLESERQVRKYAHDARRLMDRLVIAQESERRRLADDLHDLIGQNLTALGIDLTALQQRLASMDGSPAIRIDAMRVLVEQTIHAIRGVMTGLRPPALDEYGLTAALRSYAAEFAERTGMKTSITVLGPERRLAHGKELTLYRIAQEGFTNSAKHSGASAVHVRITHERACVQVVVEDDGRGFSDPVGARSAHRGGWGLPAMRERAESHGGSLRIEFPGSGTRLIVEIPADDDPHPAA